MDLIGHQKAYKVLYFKVKIALQNWSQISPKSILAFSENLISQSRQIPNLLTQLSEPKSNPRQKCKKNVLLISMQLDQFQKLYKIFHVKRHSYYSLIAQLSEQKLNLRTKIKENVLYIQENVKILKCHPNIFCTVHILLKLYFCIVVVENLHHFC